MAIPPIVVSFVRPASHRAGALGGASSWRLPQRPAAKCRGGPFEVSRSVGRVASSGSEPSGRGLAYGLAAYGLWGLFPLYWPLLEPAGAGEIVAQRIVWSLVTVLLLLATRRQWAGLGAVLRHPRRLGLLALAAAVVSGNWLVYIWGVNHGHVVETALGYFINPLVTVLLGVVLFRERLRVAQWCALGLGAASVAVLTASYGRLPWIALALAFSFSIYSLIKKTVPVGAAEGLAVESAVLFLPAVGYLALLAGRGTGGLGHSSVAHTLLLAGAGPVTLAPLMLFAASARRLPLSILGLIQYFTPCVQFGIGVLVFHEPVPPSRLIGFSLVWLALIVLSADAMRASRSAFASRRRSATASATVQGQETP
jgi:chloramphenicol-sensitive protein RarD